MGDPLRLFRHFADAAGDTSRFTRSVPRPAVLVVAVPRVCASALAFSLEQEDVYDVCAPDVTAGEPLPVRRFDAVVTTVPAPEALGDVVIELPESFDRPVTVSVHDVTFPVTVSENHPIEDVTHLLHRYLMEGEQPPGVTSGIRTSAAPSVVETRYHHVRRPS